jgi:predicted flap endonuclease-1-like 5' DNA nuclease
MKKKVTFTLPAEALDGATEALLLGDFNEWEIGKVIVLKAQKDGSFKISTELEIGKTYQYRFLLNDGRWVNDYNAEEYVSVHGFNVDNCVITVSTDVEKQPKEKKASKPKKAAKEIVKEDLTKIEGVGKQIVVLLNKNDIYSFAQLGKTAITKLNEILISGGTKFQMHNPGTWPKQAKLAAAENWEALTVLQGELKGGK